MRKMRGIDVKVDGQVYSVDQDRHGYRIRFFTRKHGYIGSYYPATKIVRFCSTAGDRHSIAVAVRGKITGIKELIRFQNEVA